MGRPGERPPAIRRAGRMMLRLVAIIAASGGVVLAFGLAIGIGTRMEGRTGVAGETVAVRAGAASTSGSAGAHPQGAPQAQDIAVPVAIGSLRHFYAALNDLASGQRTRPVTVLHLGDSHVSGDRFDAHLRLLLQNRFGDAGRALLQPGGVSKAHRARGLRFETTGAWSAMTAQDATTAVLGLTGMQATATSPQAEMTVTAQDGKFDAVEVAFLAGPDRGAANIVIDGRAHSIVTRAPEIGVQRARLPTGGAQLSVRPSGTGPVTVLSWSLHKAKPGVRYAALGMPGGGIDAIERLDELVLIDDLRALLPDLVILTFGATEALDDRLEIARYRERFSGLLRLFKRLSPDASFVVVGPPDVNRVPEFASRLRTAPATGCRALGPEELQDYDRLIAAGDERLARWFPPPRLDEVRDVLHKVAVAQGAYYWDWSRLMGGACGMHAWVHSKPELALTDHVLLTDEGYQRSARALFADLLAAYVPGAPGAPPAAKQAQKR